MSDTKAKKTTVPDGVKVPQDRKPKTEPKPETLTAYVRGREWAVPADALVGAADRALYLAKGAGRNQVVLTSDGAPANEAHGLVGVSGVA